MIDTHSHIQFKIFDKTRDQVIEDSKKIGVTKIIAVGTNLETSKKAIEVSEKYPEVFASAGIHPHHVFTYCHSETKAKSINSYPSLNAQDDIIRLEKVLQNPKVVAIGETGMDRHIYESTKYSNYQISKEFIELQKLFFEAQIKLAIKYKKALIIHNREAVSETLEVLEKNWNKALEQKSVFHMCEPDPRLLDFAQEHKVFISFGGDITYYLEKQEFLKKVPLELLVLETDSPFFAPQHIHHSGKQSASRTLNTPANLEIIVKRISEILEINLEALKTTINKNSSHLISNNISANIPTYE